MRRKSIHIVLLKVVLVIRTVSTTVLCRLSTSVLFDVLGVRWGEGVSHLSLTFRKGLNHVSIYVLKDVTKP